MNDLPRGLQYAFPSLADPTDPDSLAPGLTIREHFAAQAMQAIIGTSAAPCLTSFDGCEPNIAATAVGMADALIAELAKPAGEKP